MIFSDNRGRRWCFELAFGQLSSLSLVVAGGGVPTVSFPVSSATIPSNPLTWCLHSLPGPPPKQPRPDPRWKISTHGWVPLGTPPAVQENPIETMQCVETCGFDPCKDATVRARSAGRVRLLARSNRHRPIIALTLTFGVQDTPRALRGTVRAAGEPARAGFCGGSGGLSTSIAWLTPKANNNLIGWKPRGNSLPRVDEEKTLK